MEIGYVYERVANAIQAEIESGRIPAGGMLPSEDALREQHQVAPGTIRRALRLLRERGLIVTLPNKGSFVLPPEERPEE